MTNFIVLCLLVLSVGIPLLLFLVLAAFAGLCTIAEGFTKLAGGLGLCIYIALWILAFPVMAVIATVSGSISIWRSRPQHPSRTAEGNGDVTSRHVT